MARKRTHERRREQRDAISRELLRSIGELRPYAGANPEEVEERLRNMNYGATNSRVSKLRRGRSEIAADTE